jgi:hypothetical protein
MLLQRNPNAPAEASITAPPPPPPPAAAAAAAPDTTAGVFSMTKTSTIEVNQAVASLTKTTTTKVVEASTATTQESTNGSPPDAPAQPTTSATATSMSTTATTATTEIAAGTGAGAETKATVDEPKPPSPASSTDSSADIIIQMPLTPKSAAGKMADLQAKIEATAHAVSESNINPPAQPPRKRAATKSIIKRDIRARVSPTNKVTPVPALPTLPTRTGSTTAAAPKRKQQAGDEKPNKQQKPPPKKKARVADAAAAAGPKSAPIVWEGVPEETYPGPGNIWPNGWLKRLYERKGGATKGTKDRYWYSPVLAVKLRSMVEVKRFVAALEMYGDDEEQAKKMYKKLNI